MNQTNHFFDLGYGWLCKHCSASDAEEKQHPAGENNRLTGEGQTPALALAGWADASRNALHCPRCGIQETITEV